MSPAVRVALDARVLTLQSELAGVGQYINEMIKASQEVGQELVDLVPLSFREDVARPGVTVVPPILRLPWQSVAVPWHLWRHHYDVFHGPAFSVPPRTHTTLIVTIHDVTYLRFPETVNDDTVHYLTRVVKSAVTRAEAVIVPSFEVKEDLLRHFPRISASKIRVIALGADRLPGTGPNLSPEVPMPYLMHVGTVEPRKNLPFLLQVFDRLKMRYEIPHHLVLIGGAGWKNQAFHETLDGLRHRDAVHLMGYVDDDTMAAFYRHASLYVMPAIYEGFGIPALEAARFGVSVVANATGGIRDLDPDPGIRVMASWDPDDWAKAIVTMLSEPVAPRIAVPTWRQTWLAHVSLYREVVGR